MKRGDIQTWYSMDASGEPGTAGHELEQWFERVCVALKERQSPRAPSMVYVERPRVGNDGHAILVWRSGTLVATGLLARTQENWAVAVGTVLADL